MNGNKTFNLQMLEIGRKLFGKRSNVLSLQFARAQTVCHVRVS